MKFIALVRMNKRGSIKLPLSLLNGLEINENTNLSFEIVGNEIHISKQQFTCMLTGETSHDVLELYPGVYLSREGMEFLLKELKNL